MNMRHDSGTGKICLVFICVAAVVMFFMYGQINHSVEPFSKWDLQFYMEMADASPGISTDIPKPFSYRLLGPYIVGLLPVSSAAGFYFLTILTSACLVVLFYCFLINFGIRRPVAAFTTALFIFNKYTFGFLVWDYFQINDILSSIYIIILFMAAVNGNWPIFAFTLFFGALTRETAMVMIPVCFVLLLEQKRIMQEGKKYLFAVLPAIICFLSVRVLVRSSGGPGLIEAFMLFANKFLSFETWFRILVHTFVPLSFLPLIHLKKTISFFNSKKYMLFFMTIVFASTVFGSDNERLMAPAFVVFYLLIADIVQDFYYSRKGMLLVMLVCAFLSSFHRNIGRYPLHSLDIMMTLSVSTLLIVTITSLFYRLRGAKKVEV